MKLKKKGVMTLGPLGRFFLGFSIAGVLTFVSLVLYSRAGNSSDAWSEAAAPAATVAVIAGILSAFSEKIMECVGRFFAELFP